MFGDVDAGPPQSPPFWRAVFIETEWYCKGERNSYFPPVLNTAIISVL